jgi:COMPASS component SWD3
MADIQEYYQIFGLQYGASIAEIKKAYRRLVKEYHPDRFPHDLLLQKDAEEKIKGINIAYDALLIYEPQIVDRASAALRDRTQLNNSIDIHKTNAKTCYSKGIIEVERDNIKEAIEYFSQAIRLDPKYLEAYQYRAFLREKMGLDRSAEADSQMAWQLRRETLNDRYPSTIKTTSSRSTSPQNYGRSAQKTSLWQSLIRYVKKLIRSFKSIFFR